MEDMLSVGADFQRILTMMVKVVKVSTGLRLTVSSKSLTSIECPFSQASADVERCD